MTDTTNQYTQNQERLLLRRRMVIQHGVELSMNRLINQIIELLNQTKIIQSNMENHQLKNLLSISLENPGFEVIENFIRYQVEWDVSGVSWSHQDFGRKLLNQIQLLRSLDAKQILEQAQRASFGLETSQTNDEEWEKLLDEIWLILVRAYLGQLNRHFCVVAFGRKNPARDQNRGCNGTDTSEKAKGAGRRPLYGSQLYNKDLNIEGMKPLKDLPLGWGTCQ